MTAIGDARRAAIERGEATYQGEPCGRGHDGTRRTGNRDCVACERERSILRRRKTIGPSLGECRTNRAEALARGETTYLGAPCQRGHDGRRYVSNWGCVACSHAWNHRHPEERRAAAARCRANRKRRQFAAIWQGVNPR